ncbi:hypothetical protein T484DRAFT_1848117, partial [Baffinella frigidus]
VSRNVSQHFISPGTLVEASVTPSSYIALSKNVQYTLRFRLAAAGLPVASRLAVTFPDGINVAACTLVSSSLSGSLALSAAGSTVLLQRAGGADLPPGAEVEVVLAGVRNYYAGWSGNWTVRNYYAGWSGNWTVYTEGGGLLHERVDGVAGFVVVPCALGVSGLTLASSLTGEDTTLSLSLSVCGALNLAGTDGGRIRLALPDGFQVAGHPSPAISALSAPSQGSLRVLGNGSAACAPLPSESASATDVWGCAGLTRVSCGRRAWQSCETLTLELTPDSSEWDAGTTVQVTINGIRNAPLAGPAGELRIQTMSAAGQVSGEHGWGGLSLDARPVRVDFATSSLAANSTVTLTATLHTFNALPPNASLQILLPDDFTLPPSLWSPTASSPTASLTLTARLSPRALPPSLPRRSSRHPSSPAETSGNVTITRVGASLTRGEVWVVAIEGVVLRETSGFTDAFGARIFANDAGEARLMEYNLSSSPLYLRYLPPAPPALSRDDGPPRGGTRLTLTGNSLPPTHVSLISPLPGSGFGPVRSNPRILGAPEARAASLGASSCLETLWTSDSSLLCVTPPGADAHQLTVAAAITTNASFFSYLTPLAVISTNASFFSYLTPLVLPPGPSGANLATTGGAAVDMRGEHLGAYDTSPAGRVGGSACEASSWVSDSALACHAPAALRGTRGVTLTAATSFGSAGAVLSFDAPIVAGSRNLPTGLSVSTTVQGKGFGAWASSAAARVGGTAAESTAWGGDASLVCKVAPESGGSLRVSVTVAEQGGTSLPLFSVDAPSLLAATPPMYNQTEMVALTGAGFPAQGHATGAARFGGTGAASTLWLSATTLLCLPLRATAATLRIAVTAGVTTSTLSDAFSFAPPLPAGVLGNHSAGASVGGWVATVAGAGYGAWGVTARGRGGGTACEATQWRSDSLVECRVAASVGRTLPAAVTAARQAGTLQDAWNILPPLLTANLTTNGPASSAPLPLFLTGGNWGTADRSMGVRVGGTAAVSSSWDSDSALRCRAGGARGGNSLGLVVSLAADFARNFSRPEGSG